MPHSKLKSDDDDNLPAGVATRRVDFSPLINRAEDWNEWECRVARNRLMALLLARDGYDEEDVINAKLSLEIIVEYENSTLRETPTARRRNKKLFDDEDAWLWLGKESLVNSHSAKQYYGELAYSRDEANKDVAVRSILTVGLLFVVLAQLHYSGARPTLNSAIDFLYEVHSANKLFYANKNQIKGAWARLNCVAHLCGAFYLLAVDENTRKVDSDTLKKWQEKMPEFVATAISAESVISEISQTSKQPPIQHGTLYRMPTDLILSTRKKAQLKALIPAYLKDQITKWAKK
jgi:hypothetical protein